MDWQDKTLHVLVYGICILLAGMAIYGVTRSVDKHTQAQIECEADPGLLMAQGEWCMITLPRVKVYEYLEHQPGDRFN
jgi:hypothetical protein